MQLVMQHPHANACQQACIAMLAGRSLDEVIASLGVERLPGHVTTRTLIELGVKTNEWAYIVGTSPGYDNSLEKLIKAHKTFLCGVFSCIDSKYGHCVILHEGNLYDPRDGLNPKWPWDRYIGDAQPVQDVT